MAGIPETGGFNFFINAVKFIIKLMIAYINKYSLNVS